MESSTIWGGRLRKMFCNMFSESFTGSWAELQLPCCPSKQGELPENKTFYSTCGPDWIVVVSVSRCTLYNILCIRVANNHDSDHMFGLHCQATIDSNWFLAKSTTTAWSWHSMTTRMFNSTMILELINWPGWLSLATLLRIHCHSPRSCRRRPPLLPPRPRRHPPSGGCPPHRHWSRSCRPLLLLVNGRVIRFDDSSYDSHDFHMTHEPGDISLITSSWPNRPAAAIGGGFLGTTVLLTSGEITNSLWEDY